MNLRDVTIGTRLRAGFGAILAILVAMVLLTNYLNYNNSKRLEDGLTVANAKSLQASLMKSAMLETGIAMRNIGLQSDVSLMQKEEQKVKDQRALYEKAVKDLQALGLSGEEQGVLAEIGKLDAQTDSAFKEALAQILAFNSEGAAKILSGRIDPLSQQTLSQINKLVNLQLASSDQVIGSSEGAVRSLMYLLFGLGAAAVALGVVCAVAITRSITAPLAGAVVVAQRVASGELSSEVVVVGRDETSELLQALHDMNESLAKTVGEVRAGSELITTAAQEIAAGNADLSARTETQASSLEETASSMEELTSTVRQNADNARQANQLAVSASSVAEKGGNVVSQVVSTMGSIKESSSRIVDIIGVIDGIAFQTNILALNAAVEAARAGEQGRGFAVVASEVRNLAQRSAGAAREIKELINDSVEKVDTGSRLVDEAGQTMEVVVTSIRQVADIMGEITAATQEQSSGIEEVNQAITQMDEMTQQNAALVEEAAAAAESMNEQAEILARAVSIFKLASDGGYRAASAPAPAASRPAAMVARPAARPAARLPGAVKPAAPAAAAPAPKAAPNAAPNAAPKPPAKPVAKPVAKPLADEWEEF
ncbi:chemotaxis protein [Duganella sp. Leaf126]|uniref:methyl-accepting chemotaxis protein n=1 Tax=Duganella sp. Leaf126 TaxID=1736266 RepID=UPI0007020E13|nr:methyl-accepting chemotaxis protein [Duganella sp. Leaf126]KQQ39990.1 chemotaxis protein [Duganella sp. Leaf126]